MRRRIARFVFVFLLGFVAMILGVVTSLTLTPPGRALLARTVSRVLDRIVIGHVDVGAISGSFLYDLTLEDLVVRDTSGALLVDLPRVRVNFRLPNLLAGRVVLNGIQLDRPVIQLIKHRSGRMNYEEVLGLGKGKPGGTNPLVDFYNGSRTARSGSHCPGVPTRRSRPRPGGTRPSMPNGPSRDASSKRVARDCAG
jgi:hypothetical protein